VMDFVEGKPITCFVQRENVDLRGRLSLFIKVCSAVELAHRNEVIHRDIKPHNVLVNADREPKLLDFGIAKLLSVDSDESITTVAAERRLTPLYAAPEQRAGQPATIATDAYSLGALLYELLTNKPPVADSDSKVSKDIVTGRASKVAATSGTEHQLRSQLDRIVARAMQSDPTQRYPRVADMSQDIERCLSGLALLSTPQSHDDRASDSLKGRARSRRHAYIAAAAFGVIVLAAALLSRGSSIRWLQNHGIGKPSPDASLGIATKAVHSPAALPFEPLSAVGAPVSDTWKSIAVLPFQNLSSDPDNAYFADGIQEEVLTRLTKIGDLKVISRTSTQGYQSESGNLAEIAKQLGVANILKGSVQKAADQVRVNVHLVNVQTGSHLWSETYDRKLSDIFGVESEIAEGIAESLQAKLTGHEKQALAAKPTNNLEAYEAYLRGLVFEARSNYSSDALFKAIDFYHLAVRLDPNFALAWARLSGAHALLYSNRRDTTAARRDAAKEALEHAQKVQPNSPETLLFTGYYQYWVLHDDALAKATFERVSKMLPGNSEVLYALGAIARSEGHWDESIAYWERGLALNPRNTALLTEVAFTYAAIRQFQKAEKLYDRALDIVPNELSLMALKASIYQAEGNLQQAANLLVQVNTQTNSNVAVRIKLTQLRLEGSPERTLWVQARQARLELAAGIEKGSKQVGVALAQHVAGDTASARGTADQARNTLESLKKDQANNAFVAAALAAAYAILDEKDLALNEAQRAITLSPSNKDRLSGPGLEENLALVEMIIGENDRAIADLTRLLETPYGGWLYSPTPITPALLRLDPVWDPLRVDPNFQRLCKGN
jgi:TolB-like protein/Tfp pilus assembly protein PilF